MKIPIRCVASVKFVKGKKTYLQRQQWLWIRQSHKLRKAQGHVPRTIQSQNFCHQGPQTTPLPSAVSRSSGSFSDCSQSAGFPSHVLFLFNSIPFFFFFGHYPTQLKLCTINKLEQLNNNANANSNANVKAVYIKKNRSDLIQGE